VKQLNNLNQVVDLIFVIHYKVKDELSLDNKQIFHQLMFPHVMLVLIKLINQEKNMFKYVELFLQLTMKDFFLDKIFKKDGEKQEHELRNSSR